MKRLGIETVGDLQRFRFTELVGGYFRFMLPSVPSLGASVSLPDQWRSRETVRKFRRAGVIGYRRLENARIRIRRKVRAALRQTKSVVSRRVRGSGETGTLVAYAELNRKVETALRHLQERSL